MEEIRVSVIIPVYNVERYLVTCIESLLAQTLKSIEFIFVNDASPDNSLEILRNYEMRFPDVIRVIDSRVNLKQGGARNLGIKAAKGDFVGFIDSDDFISPTMYEDLLKAVDACSADASFCQYTIVKDENDIYNKEPLIVWPKEILALNGKSLGDKDIDQLLINPIGGVVTGIWKKEILIQNTILFPEGLRYEDNYWVSLVWNYIGKIALVEKIAYFYRVNQDSTVHKRNPEYHIDRVTIEKKLLAEVKRRDLFDRHYVAWEYNFVTRFFINTYVSYVRLFDKVDRSFLKQLNGELNTEFPDWSSNEFCRAKISSKRKLLLLFIRRAPVLTGVLMNRLFKLKPRHA